MSTSVAGVETAREELSAAAASGELGAAGLTPVKRERTVTDEGDDGKVVDQRPGGGSEANKGDTVVIVVGKFKAPKTTTSPPPAEAPPTP